MFSKWFKRSTSLPNVQKSKPLDIFPSISPSLCVKKPIEAVPLLTEDDNRDTSWGDDKDRELSVYLHESNEIKENIRKSREMVEYCHKKLNGILYIDVINENDKKDIASKMTEASNISAQSRVDLYKLRTSMTTISSEQQKKMCTNILSSLMKSFSSLLREIETVSELLIRKSGTTFEEVTMQSPLTHEDEILVSQDKAFASLAHMYQREMEQEIKNLEKSVVELHQLFVDTATLLESQGQMLDMIEPSIFETIGQTNTALHMLQAAESHKKSSRLKKALIITIIGITLLIIIVACVAVVCVIAGV